MKINGTSIIPSSVEQSKSSGKQYPTFNGRVTKDTFTKSTAPANAKTEQEICQNIRDNESEQMNFARFIADVSAYAFMRIRQIANGIIPSSLAEKTADTITDAYINSLKSAEPAAKTEPETQTVVIETVSEEDKQPTTKKTKTTKATVSKDKTKKTEQNKVDTEKTDKKPERKQTAPKETKETKETQELVKFVFPKRLNQVGQLPGPLRNLKNITVQLELPPGSAKKLSHICEDLLFKKDYVIENKTVSYEELASCLTAELTNSKDNLENIKNIINDYYDLANLKPKDSDVKAPDTTTATPTETKTLETPKSETAEIKTETTTATSKARKHKSELDLLVEKEEALYKDNTNWKISYFKTGAGPNDYDCKTVLKMLIDQFKNRYHSELKENEQFERQQIAGFVTDEMIENDMKMKNHKYDHITKYAVSDLADIINSDSRLQNLFCLHAALRFLDRFVFTTVNDSTSMEEIKKQCHKSSILLKKVSKVN